MKTPAFLLILFATLVAGVVLSDVLSRPVAEPPRPAAERSAQYEVPGRLKRVPSGTEREASGTEREASRTLPHADATYSEIREFTAESPRPPERTFTAARERFWVPSEAILILLYDVNSAQAGLYDERRDEILVDRAIVREAWLRDEGLRGALARACELADMVSQAVSIGRFDVADALEEDRAASIAELWRFYSPAAYTNFLKHPAPSGEAVPPTSENQ